MKKRNGITILLVGLMVGMGCEKGMTETDKKLQEQVKQLEAELVRARSEVARWVAQDKAANEELAKTKRKWEEAEAARKTCESKDASPEGIETHEETKAVSTPTNAKGTPNENK